MLENGGKRYDEILTHGIRYLVKGLKSLKLVRRNRKHLGITTQLLIS